MIIDIWDKLSENGRLGVITSNSWLGTIAGRNFFSILQKYYFIEGVYNSDSGTWFRNADIETVIIVLKKKSDINDDVSAFHVGTIHKGIDDWDKNNIFNNIKNSIILKRKIDESVMSIKEVLPNQIEFIKECGLSLSVLFYNIDWLSEIQDKLCSLKEYLIPLRGEKTGQDRFFYLKDKNVVDSEFVIKGYPKNEITRLIHNPKTDVFFCLKTREELRAGGYNKTLGWIKQAEDNLNKSIKAKGKEWHIVNKNAKVVRILMRTKPYKRVYCIKSESDAFINQSFLGFAIKDEHMDIDLLHALLNSMIYIFNIEAIGLGMALGVLDLRITSFKSALMLNPSLLNDKQVKEIKVAFYPLCNREIKSTIEEFQMNDRINFEKTVLRCFNIEDYYVQIRDTIIKMQNSRIEKSKKK